MIKDNQIDKYLTLMRMDIKYPKGSRYFDRLSHMIYEIINTDNHYIRFMIADNGTELYYDCETFDLAIIQGLLEPINNIN